MVQPPDPASGWAAAGLPLTGQKQWLSDSEHSSGLVRWQNFQIDRAALV